jgi:hypothetical protein
MAADGSGGAGLSGAPAEPIVDPSWLAARVAADTSARAATIDTLLSELISYVIDVGGPGDVLEIIDLGAGTGAHERWLAPRLPLPQRWIHLDHDPVISRSMAMLEETVIIDDSVEALDRLLATSGRRLVTCSALLDVLTTAEIDAVCGAVISNQVPVLFSLTVTGALSLTPADPRDQLLLDAFNDHQRRAGRAGPDAALLAVGALLAGGMAVRTQDTPWLLTASHSQSFVARMLQERLEAAVAYQPALARTAAAWFELRRVQLGLGVLRIELAPSDLLGLPGGR